MSKFVFIARLSRPALLALTAAAFFAASFFSVPIARMQTDYNRIVFDRYMGAHDYRIVTVASDGSNEIELGAGSDPVYSFDAAKIAFVMSNGETGDIWTMNPDGSNRARLTENYQSYSPVWSPDNSKIAFVNDGKIYTINSDGSNQQPLNTDDQFTRESAPVFSADNSKIYFFGAKSINGLTREDVYSASADNSGAVVRLSNLNALFGNGKLAISPDNTKLLLNYQNDLQTLDASGSGQLTNITNNRRGDAEQAAFSPDGARIVFRRRNVGLFVMNQDGGNPTDLIVVGANPSFHPLFVEPPPPTPTPTPIVAADLAIEIAQSAATVERDQNAVYTATARNHGAGAASGAALTATVPASMTIVSIAATQGSCNSANNLICDLGSINAGNQAVVTIVAKANAAGQFAVGATIAARELDPNAANNTTQITTQIVEGCPENVTDAVRVVRTGAVRNPRTGEVAQGIFLQNTSGRPLNKRTAIAFDNLTPGVNVAARQNPGATQCAAPLNSQYLIAEARNSEWRQNEFIVLAVSFTNPQRRQINYNLRVLNGSNRP